MFLSFLENFKRMELEKKKAKPFKKGPIVPMIRYHSSMMKRFIPKQESEFENKNVEMLADSKKIKDKDQVFERTFMSYSHIPLLKQVFAPLKNERRKQSSKLCTLTKYGIFY